MTIDYKIDQEHDSLCLKSCNGKLFLIGKERASRSGVWKGMLHLGNENRKSGEMDESKAIRLEEDASNLLVFFTALVPSKWVERKLSIGEVIKLLGMSEKYQAPNVTFYVPSMVQIIPSKWTFQEVVKSYHCGSVVRLNYLKDMALIEFLTFGPLRRLENGPSTIKSTYTYRPNGTDSAQTKVGSDLEVTFVVQSLLYLSVTTCM